MKIKHKSIVGLSTALIVLFTSCNKIFDELAVNPNQPGMTGYFTTPESVNEAVGALYGYISTQRSLGASGSKIQIIRSDEASSNSDYGKPGMYGVDLNPSYYTLEQPFTLMYTAASQASFIIEATPQVDFRGDEIKKNAYIGEAYFWRAFAHYYLLINYRKVSPITKMPENSADYVREPAAPDFVWDLIQSDLENAKKLLPNKAYWTTTNVGRVTAGSAAGLLGKVYLYRSGIESHYGANKQTYYQEAANEFADLISGKYGSYQLTSNYNDNFDVAHENNSESVFEIQFKGDVENAAFNPGLATSGLAFDTRGIMLPGAGVGYEGVVHNWLYDTFVQSTDRDGHTDLRMFSTIMFDDLAPEIKLAQLQGKPVRLAGPGGSTWEQLYPEVSGKKGFSTVSNPLAAPFKAGIKKGLDYSMPTQKNGNGTLSIVGVGAGVREYVYNQPRAHGVNWRYIRYADILLMYAEAILQGATSAGISATDAINQVRNRANLPPTTSTDLNTLKQERILELSLEGHRFYDLLRWGELNSRFKQLEQEDPNFKRFVSTTDFKGFIENRNEWLPIPINEINTNPYISQNTGY